MIKRFVCFFILLSRWLAVAESDELWSDQMLKYEVEVTLSKPLLRFDDIYSFEAELENFENSLATSDLSQIYEPEYDINVLYIEVLAMDESIVTANLGLKIMDDDDSVIFGYIELYQDLDPDVKVDFMYELEVDGIYKIISTGEAYVCRFLKENFYRTYSGHLNLPFLPMCPILKGIYTINNFHVDESVYPSALLNNGKYALTVKIIDSNKEILAMKIYTNVQKV